MTDNAIISGILSGSTQGYKYLFDKHYGSVNYFIYRMVNSLTEAEDLTMITFEKAFLKLDTWEAKYKFSTWLFAIARNAVIDFKREQKIRLNGGVELDKVMHKPDINTPSPYQELIAKELQNIIEGKIDKLPMKSRSVMKLHFIGYSDIEIVEKLNMMHGNVRSLIHCAKAKLKSELYEKNIPISSYCVA